MTKSSVGPAGCVLILAMASCGQPYSQRDLVGTWRGSSAEWPSATLKIEADGDVHLRFVDRNGKAYIVDGTVETDFSKDPVPLSIRKIPQLSHSLHTVIRLWDRDRLQMARFASRWRLRPISFDPRHSILFERE